MPERIQLTARSGYTYEVSPCLRCGMASAKGQHGFCTPLCRFWFKVARSDGCWEWRGARNQAAGYGRFDANGTRYLAHRYAYELLRGPIPHGMQLDHLCRNTMCVNPDHVEVVTEAEHGRRSGLDSGAARKDRRANQA